MRKSRSVTKCVIGNYLRQNSALSIFIYALLSLWHRIAMQLAEGAAFSQEYSYRVDKSIKGRVLREAWYDANDELHRENGPALVEYDHRGRLSSQHWYYAGMMHREGGPAETYYSQLTGRLDAKVWFSGGMLHRSRGPAHILFNQFTGAVNIEMWYQEGVLHRASGPAYIDHTSRAEDGVYQEWYDHGTIVLRGRCEIGDKPKEPLVLY
jgi:hypothetical protein